MMKLRTLVFTSAVIVALSALISYSQSNAFAGDPDVPRMPDIKVYKPDTDNFLCGVEENNFKVGDKNSIEASHLVPTTIADPVYVDIYVYPNREQSLGDLLDPYPYLAKVSIQTTFHGRIDCTLLIHTVEAVTEDQYYDIMIDTTPFGVVNDGGYFDGGKGEEGATYDFRVEPPKRPQSILKSINLTQGQAINDFQKSRCVIISFLSLNTKALRTQRRKKTSRRDKLLFR